jgi:D-glycero-D-manno-heptose 1,7-bisphosphate phosphatase
VTGTRIAAFLDRDGTIIEDTHYLRDPADMRLVPGAAAAIASLAAAGVLAVVATNQSGIARGIVTEEEYQATRRRLDDLLAAEGVALDASYHCPHAVQLEGDLDCRKPGVGMFLRAARDLDIDLARSLYLGDRQRDVEPGLTLGGTGTLVPSPETGEEELAWAHARGIVAPSLGDGIARFLASHRR